MFKFISHGIASQCGAIPFKMMPIPPAVGAALITGGFGIGDSIIKSFSQSSTNKNYLKGVRETNETNLRIAQETNDLNRQLYERNVRDNRINAAMQNAYDSPAAQLARLRQAGINAYQSDHGVQIQSASPNAAVAANMQVPNQVPSPFDNVNLGGIAKDVISSYQSAQQIQDKNMDLYMKGIDTQYYLTKTINEIDMQMLDITSKGIHNEQDRERLAMLTEERKQYSEQLRLQSGLNSANISKIQEEANEIQKRVFRDDKLALAQMQHWSKQDMIGFYEAETGRRLSYIQEKHVDSLVRQVNNNILQDWHRVRQGWHDIHVKQELNAIKKAYYALDKPERLLTRRLLQQDIMTHAAEYKFMLEKANAPLNTFFRNVFGIDTQDVLKAAGAAGAAYIGARTGRSAKGNVVSYPSNSSVTY